ncbi:MAG: rRNA maturation RNase YbeY [Rhodothermales bacterium]|nr:rRNA maturation RNase YbeY [Rhodothermales bacterium]
MTDDAFEIVLDHRSRTVDEHRLRRALAALAVGEGRTVDDVTVVLTDHATVRKLNVQYLAHDYDTDVLSFGLGDGDPDDPAVPLEGEVYVDLDTAAERCAEFGTDYETEAVRYALHGVLHLCGYDDATPDAKAAMHRLEDRYLAASAPA